MSNLILKISENYGYRIVLSSLFLILTWFTNVFSGRVIIPLIAPDRTPLLDIAFNTLPYIKEMMYLSEFIVLLISVIFVYLVYRNGFKDLDRYIFGIGLIYFLRTIAIVLNPVEHSWVMYDDRFDILNGNPISDVNGFFFSGHIAWTTLLVIYISNLKRELILIGVLLIFINAVSMLISRSHYMIDIYAGILFSILIAYWIGVLPFKDSYSKR